MAVIGRFPAPVCDSPPFPLRQPELMAPTAGRNNRASGFRCNPTSFVFSGSQVQRCHEIMVSGTIDDHATLSGKPQVPEGIAYILGQTTEVGARG